jgi:hypothetical protein
MSKGIDRYQDKQRRAVRRKNHIAKDLGDRKYHPRLVPNKKHKYEDWDNQDWERFSDYDINKDLGLASKE